MDKTFDEQLESILRFDKIRLYKLAELSQYSVLACLLSIKVGNLVNKLIPAYDSKETLYETYAYIILNVIVIIVTMYYIRKIVMLVPYIFSYDADYIVSKNDESLLGFSVGFGIVFTMTQVEFGKRILPAMDGRGRHGK